MKNVKKIALGIGKVLAAILGGALLPILIWVALGVVIYHKVHQRKAQTQQVPTLGQLLGAGLKR